MDEEDMNAGLAKCPIRSGPYEIVGTCGVFCGEEEGLAERL